MSGEVRTFFDVVSTSLPLSKVRGLPVNGIAKNGARLSRQNRLALD
jgi:hypothetical protein